MLQGSPFVMKLVEADRFGGKLSWNLSLTAASLGGGGAESSEDGEEEGVRMSCWELNGRIADRGL